MELVKCSKDTLLNPLQVVCGIVERRHTLPVLANVLFKKSANTLTLTSTDIEIQIKTQLSVEDGEANDVNTTVNAKKLLDILKSLPEGKDVALNLKDNKVAISSGKSKFNLQTLPANDFPEMAKTGEFTHKITIKQKSLTELLNKAHFAMAVQDIRYYLNGMLMMVQGNELVVVATDGHRLAYAQTSTDQDLGEKKEFILPRKTVLELQRLLKDNDEDVVIELSNNQIRFTFNDIELTSKLVEGKFPDYQKVIPKDYTKAVQINRQVLQQALQRVAILSNEKFKGVRCLVEANTIKVSSTNTDQENALEELDVEYSGEPLDIGFNVHYLLDVLSNQKTENIILNLGNSANQSVLITVTEDDTFKYVVMPMRI
ncbi:DNA polymerase III subunit beta [Hydromonas duriensis]|uniref:Beta sliding clamp n=1 Tax=Hydromonas duriensis TaxID=1527608 RepID=A0A4V3DK38_9BURK|nr:DNA polymerase III subunit beta [Hydromonas duriensis]TDR32513.1 DNA polymerase III beta subunit [Hydromonas duriensis]